MYGIAHQSIVGIPKEDNFAHAWVGTRLNIKLIHIAGTLHQLDTEEVTVCGTKLRDMVAALMCEFNTSRSSTDGAWKDITTIESSILSMRESIDGTNLDNFLVSDAMKATTLSGPQCVVHVFARVNDYKHKSESYTHRKHGSNVNLFTHIELAIAVKAFVEACNLWTTSASYVNMCKEKYSAINRRCRRKVAK